MEDTPKAQQNSLDASESQNRNRKPPNTQSSGQEDEPRTDQPLQSGHARTVRRRFLQLCGSGIAVGVAGCSGNSSGGSKVPKSQVNYQDHPKNGEKCAGCAYFLPDKLNENTGKCTKVKGKIAPDAWCSLYIPK